MDPRDRRAASILIDALPLPPETVHVSEATGRLIVQIRHRGIHADLLPVWAGSGYPSDTEDAIGAHLSASNGIVTPVFVSYRFSPNARKILKAKEASWADATGRVRILAPPGLLISRDALLERPPPPVPGNSAMKWSDAAGAVAELLLTRCRDAQSRSGHSHVLPRTATIGADVTLSASHVARVLQAFDSAGWTEKQGGERGTTAARSLVDPQGMLASWAEWHRRRRLTSTGAHATWQDASTFLRDRLVPAIPTDRWAVTGWAALQEVAPVMSDIPTLDIYIEPKVYDLKLRHILDGARLRTVATGARVSLLRAESHVITQAHRVSDLRVVSEIRLYGDLLRFGVRGEDAAEHLRESRLGF